MGRLHEFRLAVPDTADLSRLGTYTNNLAAFKALGQRGERSRSRTFMDAAAKSATAMIHTRANMKTTPAERFGEVNKPPQLTYMGLSVN
jgi:hypothetical protein